MISKRVLTCALTATLLLTSQYSFAQEGLPTVRFRPSILAGAELPPAGEKVELKVTLDGLADIQSQLRVTIIQDDEFEERFLAPVSYDEKRRPIYSTVLYAPRAELRYRFEATQRDGTKHQSREFISRRDCVENIDLVDSASLLTQASSPAELVMLQTKVATRLEHEVQLLENALELLGHLEKELP